MRRNIYTLLIFLMVVSCFICGCASNDNRSEPPLITVDHVDLKRYTGLWYEIARIPNRFQRHCVRDTTATYTLLENGKITVLNRCIDKNGGLLEAEGVARVMDHRSNARLEVSFVSLFGVYLFWGDYWIIDLGKQYEYAVVGTPNREYGWVLSRTPRLEESVLKEIYANLQHQGYDPRAFELSSPATF